MTERSKTPAVAHAAAVLSLLAGRGQPLTVTTIARELDLPRTSVVRICETLRLERLLEQGSDGTFWLGPKIAILGAAARLAIPRSLKLGVLVPDRSNAYYTTFVDALEADVASAGDQLVICSADDHVDEQRRQWWSLIDSRVDAILVDSVATSGFEDLVRTSREHAIPVVAVGTRIAGADLSVTSDNVQAGLLAGRELALRLPPGSKLAIVDGLHKNANSDRIAGFLDALSDFPEHQVVTRRRGRVEDEKSGQEVADRLFEEDDDIDGIFAVCDPLALGILTRVRASGYRTVITSVDGRSQAIREILSDGPFIGTVAQDPAGLARTALAHARELCEELWPHPRVISLPVRMIGKAEAARYHSWG